VRGGQTVPAGEFTVVPGQGEAQFSLDWPGSDLELILVDPRGRELREGSPGLVVDKQRGMRHYIVDRPAAGRWKAMVVGVDVPEGRCTWNLVGSVRQAPSTGNVAIAAAAAAVALIGCAVAWRLLRRKRRGAVAAPAGGDMARRLARIDELQRRGLISDGDYDRKRHDLLDDE
jgi:hypothetical protein